MVKVGLLGLRGDRETILTALHDLRVAQIETLSPEALKETVPERGTEMQRVIGDEALRFRGLLAALPRVPTGPPRSLPTIYDILDVARSVPIDAEVGDLKREEDRLLTEERSTDQSLGLLGKLSFYGDRLEYLRATHFLTFYGETERATYDALRDALPAEADATFLEATTETGVQFLVVLRPAGTDALARLAQGRGIRLSALPDLSGTVPEETARLTARRAEVVARRAEIARRLTEISVQWYSTVAALDEALSVENRKIEVLTKLGAGRASFALEAWVPERDLARLDTVLRGIVGDRIHLFVVPTTEEAPTMMDNPKGVRRFEFFIRFYSLPQASEWDPTLTFAVVFPIFFGLMLGDWGYGLTILLICLWMIRGFPGARYLPGFGRRFVKMIMGPQGMQNLAWALLPGCGIAIGLGLLFDEFFGVNVLHLLLGTTPLAVDPLHHVGTLLLIAGFIGLAMVTFGFLLGALKEQFHHHRRGMLGKVGGVLFAWGIAGYGLQVIHAHTIVPPLSAIVGGSIGGLVAGAALLLYGEGAQTAIMGLIEIVSHILSYTRLVGILLASVVLAIVINDIAGLARTSALLGPVVGILLAAIVIAAGQAFNVILGVFEPGIQGARLIFVEHFSKFYSGNGRRFQPFGAARRHTLPSVAADAGAAGPLMRGN
jgi:V/A-type H+-transporting ATPase subunit I